ncbi:tRNA (N6-isopentenyl adenosine(37)-C2)-methylthiotransferase MiaB [bacterium]|nr:tRNA (N6-isopentenyl adenosine(37)-C2)-methylthiotransferase MiaB [bacterium]
MNKYDSEIIAGLLTSEGYRITEKEEEATVYLINTCSVREHAEKRALGRIGTLSHWKRHNPQRKLGVIGCMAQRMGETLFIQKPFLDFILGPDEYSKLPDLIANGHQEHCTEISLHGIESYSTIEPKRRSGIDGFVAVSRGCNNYCSYCIVPYTRGRERSRPIHDILDEIEKMIDENYVEVTLLGQNVNTYNDGQHDFADLLQQVNNIAGIHRIRFMTSHPKDLTDKILQTVASSEKVCPHLHLPLQSGSDPILSKMNRGYTRKEYTNLVDRARRVIPDVSITSDIMVGFPGETETDFQETVRLMKDVLFDDAFTYRYSPREGTKAFQMNDDVSEQKKRHRLDQIIKLQRQISFKKRQNLIGRCIEVLPEKTSKQSPDEWMGKTPGDHVVIFPKKHIRLGQPVKVLIESCRGSTLRGKILNCKTGNN